MKFTFSRWSIKHNAGQVLARFLPQLLYEFSQYLFVNHWFSSPTAACATAARRTATKSSKSATAAETSASPAAATASIPSAPPRTAPKQQPPKQDPPQRSRENNDHHDDDHHDSAKRNPVPWLFLGGRWRAGAGQLNAGIMRDHICNPHCDQSNRAVVIALPEQRHGF